VARDVGPGPRSVILVVFGALMVGYGLIAARLERLSVGPALAFTACGLVVGDAGLGWFVFPLESDFVVTLAELTLALVLFNDAASLQMRGSGRDAPVIGRLLAIGLPLSIGLGAIAALIFFPGTALPVALLVGAILAPTDAALASAIVTNPNVPTRVRRILNIESGLNDGIASPFVVLFTVLAITPGGSDSWLTHAIAEAGTAVIVGGLVGAAGAWLLVVADERGWTSETYQQVVYGALALVAYGLSLQLGGNGFIAAFVAGLAFRRVQRGRITEAQHLTEGLAVLMSIVVWLLFGAVLAGAVIADGIVIAGIAYAVVSLTVVRMLPVAIALVGSHLRREPVAFIGWFGPRGLASVAFGLTAIVALDEAGVGTVVLREAITWTVLLSVVLHGLSAAPLAGRFGRDTTQVGGIDDVGVSSRSSWVLPGTIRRQP
jgi:sodium/hydrogen antiporter